MEIINTRQNKKNRAIDERRVVFSYTEQYLKKRRVMKNIAPFGALVGIILTTYFILGSHPKPGNPAIYLCFVSGVCFLILMYKYGKPFSEYRKNDIYIKNNHICFERHTKVRFGGGTDYVEVSNIRRVDVKKHKIVIHADYKETSMNLVLHYKKYAFPTEIQNVDEFIRFAQSQVGIE